MHHYSERRRPDLTTPAAPPRRDAGFSMIELMVVLGLIAVAMGMAALIMPGAIKSARSDSGASVIVAALRLAREQAISQRRNMRITFTAPNRITVSREEVPMPPATAIALTDLSTTVLENGMTFQVYPSLTDTPDLFGNATATFFNGAATIRFTSEGTLVSQTGDPVNGSVFLGRGTDTMSARAVTIFGPTALIRQWRWDGQHWVS
jgi:prepilin-type N-terminal cleavage/methylation domain-containing protein